MAASPLIYPTGDFQPFTKILSAEVNGKFNAITTLLNTTKLSDTNVQQNGLSWDRLTLQVSSQVAVTNTLGQLTVTAILPAINGGLGFSFASTTLNAGLVVQANSTGSALTIDAGPTPPSVKMYQWNHFL